MDVTYFIGSISFDTTKQGLYDYFSQYGKVVSVRLIKEKMTAKSKGFAFITMDEHNSVTAINANNTELDGRTIYVNVEAPRQEYVRREDGRKKSGLFPRREVFKPIESPIILVNRHISIELFKVIKENPLYIYEISSTKYEQLIAQMIEGFGYEVELTKKTRDGGKDIIAKRRDVEDESFYIECKRFTSKMVNVSIVREFHSVLMLDKINRGILATSSNFTSDAKKLIERIKNSGCQINMKDFDGVYNWIDIYLDTANSSSTFVSKPILTFFH